MKKAIVALLFATAAYGAVTQTSARLTVRITPGFDVIVDGAAAGKTTTEEGGRILLLPPGAHHVVVRSPDGREGSFDIVLNAGEARDVTLSPLGLRKPHPAAAEDISGALRVVCVPEDCTVAFKPPVQAVPAGRYPLTVNRGKTMLRLDVDVPESTIVTVEANFNAGTIRTIETRRKPRKLAVLEANDPLSRLAVPAHWKTAIRSAMPAGVEIVDADTNGNQVRVMLRTSSLAAALAMIRSIEQSNAFASAGSATAPRKDAAGQVTFDLVFTFTGE